MRSRIALPVLAPALAPPPLEQAPATNRTTSSGAQRRLVRNTYGSTSVPPQIRHRPKVQPRRAGDGPLRVPGEFAGRPFYGAHQPGSTPFGARSTASRPGVHEL